MDKISEERLAVTREEAISFLEGACRNWSHVPKLTEEDIRDVSMELLRFVASRRQSPAGVEVKGLEWSTGWGTIKAQTPIGHYFIDDNRDGGFKVRLEDTWSSWASNSEAAKAAAQADYERRVLSCLSTALSSEAHNG